MLVFSKFCNALAGMIKVHTCFYHPILCEHMEQNNYVKQLRGLQEIN
jgi:hypothetical protein